jgi:uncharacterized membrane protein YphA (DoxX/SURF4 family)
MEKIYLLEPTTLRVVVWRRRIVALLRIFCGGLCAVDAYYRWLTLEHESLPLVVGWLASRLSMAHAHLFVIGGAAVETIIACCLLCGALTSLACGLGIVLTLLGYATTGALELLLGPGSFDLGILFVFGLAFLGLALSNSGEMYGMDGWLFGKLLMREFLRWMDADNHRGSLRGSGKRVDDDNRKGLSPCDLVRRGDERQPQGLSLRGSQSVDVADAPRRRQRVLFM